MTKTIFNKGAFKIKAKASNEIKYLDGGFNITLTVNHYEMGNKVQDIYEIQKDCLNNFNVVKA